MKALRILLILAIAFSFGAAFRPAQAAVMETRMADCCSQMKGEMKNCSHHAPRSLPEQQCCAACFLGLSLFLSPSARLVPPVAERESFVPYSSGLHFLSHQPPVPPPRSALV